MQFLQSGNTLLIFLKGSQYSLRTEDARYNKVMERLFAKDEDGIVKIMTEAKISVNDIMEEVKKTFENLEVIVNDSGIQVDGCEMGGFLVSRIRDLRQRKLPYDHLINFLKRAFLNPKKFVIEELFDWLDRNNMPITDDGYFLAYKRVKEDYTDCHTGTVDNSVGNHLVFPMEHRTERADRSQECSSGGYHVCAFSYLEGFSGSRTLVVKVDPQFVYSFPNWGGAKIQVLEYDVIAELDVDKGDRIPEKIVSQSGPVVYEGDDDDDDNECDEDVGITYTPSQALTLKDLHDRFSFTILVDHLGSMSHLMLFKLPAGSTGTSSSRIIDAACTQHPGIKDLIKLLDNDLSVSGLGDSIKNGKVLTSGRVVYLYESFTGGRKWQLKATVMGQALDLFEVRL